MLVGRRVARGGISYHVYVWFCDEIFLDLPTAAEGMYRIRWGKYSFKH